MSASLTLTPNPKNATQQTITGKVSSGTAFVGKTTLAITQFTAQAGGCTKVDLAKATVALVKGKVLTIK